MAEDDTQTTQIRPARGSGKTAYSPDSPAGVEDFWSTDVWVAPLPTEPEFLVAVPRHR